jgi:acetyltransferase-like isoleucine patch superfamily enzyme
MGFVRRLKSKVKSKYYTRKYSSDNGKLNIGSNATIKTDDSGEIKINGEFTFGRYFPMGRFNHRPSRLVVKKDGEFLVNTTDRKAKINQGAEIMVMGGGEFYIGESYINPRLQVLCYDKITIGDGCAISYDVELLDSNVHNIWIDEKKSKKEAPIIIEDNVWVGNNVSIQKGVRIGKGAIIASNSVVTNNIPEQTLAAGVPAEPIKNNVDWE